MQEVNAGAVAEIIEVRRFKKRILKYNQDTACFVNRRARGGQLLKIILIIIIRVICVLSSN